MVLATRTKQDRASFALAEPCPLLPNLRRTHMLPWDLTQRRVGMDPITPHQLTAPPTTLALPPVWIKEAKGHRETTASIPSSRGFNLKSLPVSLRDNSFPVSCPQTLTGVKDSPSLQLVTAETVSTSGFLPQCLSCHFRL